MARFQIRHETLYHFDQPTGFGAWRLMLRPVDTHAVRLVEASLELSPPGETLYSLDAYGNSVCQFAPRGEASGLSIISNLVVDRYPTPLAGEDPKSWAPVIYDEATRIVLEPFMRPEFRAEESAFTAWVAAHAPDIGEPALYYLRRLTWAISREFGYARRETEGTHTPDATVRAGAGACRDLAALMIETLRRFGFAARFASGYLYAPGGDARGAGATHAWCDVYLPDFGWLEFDPTNGIAESHDLIRVASTRTPQEAAPVSGSTLKPVAASLIVNVSVEMIG